MRSAELRQASAELGVSGVTLLGYADGELAAIPAAELARHLRDLTGQPPDRIDLCVRVRGDAQRKAALLHASQLSPATMLWRRLRLAGDCEHGRWLLQFPDPAPDPGRRLADHR